MVLKAIESVINQTHSPFEIIIIDDGSTDGTSTLFPISGVSYFKVKHCGYPGKVRNIGVNHSTGDYIAFLDSDDIWHKEKLEKQSAYINSHQECKLLHTKEKWIMNSKVISQKKRKHNRSGNVFNDSLQGCILGPSTVLMKRSLYLEFNGFNEQIEVGEDYDLWLRITDKVEIDYLDEELITKNAGHGDQLSFKYGFIEPFKIDVLENLITSYGFREANFQLVVSALLLKYDIVINGCIKRSNEKEALLYQKRKKLFFSEEDNEFKIRKSIRYISGNK